MKGGRQASGVRKGAGRRTRRKIGDLAVVGAGWRLGLGGQAYQSLSQLGFALLFHGRNVTNMWDRNKRNT